MSKRWIGCPIETEYFGEERKRGKQDRKAASAKDRSKYKKTDQKKQLAKQQEEETAPAGELLQRGRVLSIASQAVFVDCQGKTLECGLRGILKKEKTLAKNLVTVGDFVLLEKETGMIVRVEPRTTVLSRADNLSRKKEQLIAANIQQVLITVSLLSPPLKPSLIDRYIIAAQKGSMDPVIVVNKIDLLDSIQADSEELAHQKLLYHEMLKAYPAAGIPIISVSSLTGAGIAELKEIMRDTTSVFSGQSGAGKSSLINTITGKTLRTGEIVEKTRKGSHTTTTANLLRLEFGGWCVDTPGIKSFGVWDLEQNELDHYFPEIFACGRRCRYPDCAHCLEEQCAVKEAVEKGEISHLRYESYLGLMESIRQKHTRR